MLMRSIILALSLSDESYEEGKGTAQGKQNNKPAFC